MSKYSDLANSMHNRITEKTGTMFSDIQFVIDPMLYTPKKFPVLITYWYGTERKGEEELVNQTVRSMFTVTMISLIRVKASTADAAKDDVFTLLDAVKTAIVGYQPKIENVYQTWPITCALEEFFEMDGGELGIVIVWEMMWEEVKEVYSEYFS